MTERNSYVFWAERGQFKVWDSRRIPGPREVLEIRRGSVRLLQVPKEVARLYRMAYSGYSALGVVLASIAYWSLSASDVEFALRVFAILLAIVLTLVAFAMSARRFPEFMARRSPGPGLDLVVVHLEYHAFYHRLVVKSMGEEFKLTVGGLPGQVRRAVVLSGKVQNVAVR